MNLIIAFLQYAKNFKFCCIQINFVNIKYQISAYPPQAEASYPPQADSAWGGKIQEISAFHIFQINQTYRYYEFLHLGCNYITIDIYYQSHFKKTSV